MAAGASGYLLKNTSHKRLKALVAVAAGERFMAQEALDDLKSAKAQNGERTSANGHLTKREREILRLAALQRTNNEIAEELGLSVHRSKPTGRISIRSSASTVPPVCSNTPLIAAGTCKHCCPPNPPLDEALFPFRDDCSSRMRNQWWR
ncbi:MAG: response regulator transcription factor [Flavobacteriales bacterium]|nr:response regulator transcription factor [Flavobacteriales bacterium]